MDMSVLVESQARASRRRTVDTATHRPRAPPPPARPRRLRCPRRPRPTTLLSPCLLPRPPTLLRAAARRWPQGELLDQIEYTVSQSVNYTGKAVEELRTANKYQKKVRSARRRRRALRRTPLLARLRAVHTRRPLSTPLLQVRKKMCCVIVIIIIILVIFLSSFFATRKEDS